MRLGACVFLLAGIAGAAPDADGYFDLGLEYLRKGFYRPARSAFAESLVRAPGQPVPLVFYAVAAAAEGRPTRSCAVLLRTAYTRLPAGKGLVLDLRRRLPSPRALALLQADLRRRLARSTSEAQRIDALTVLAFLEVQDGTPATATALEALLKARPKDPFAKALDAVRDRARATHP
jgi:hypothetical protein